MRKIEFTVATLGILIIVAAAIIVVSTKPENSYTNEIENQSCETIFTTKEGSYILYCLPKDELEFAEEKAGGLPFAPVQDDTMWDRPPKQQHNVAIQSVYEPTIILWIYSEKAERNINQFGILAEHPGGPKFLLEVSPAWNFGEVVEYINNYDNRNNTNIEKGR